MCHFRDKMAQLSWTNFLVQTIIITFIYLLALFIMQNLQKILTADPKLWGCPRPKIVHLPQTIFLENYQYDFHLTISPSHCAKFQKNPSSRSRVMRMRNFWASAQMRIFQKACYWTLFLSFLCTCQKSKWDINVLVKCSWLKKTGISLMESHF